MEVFRRIDHAWARFEGGLTVFVLILMVFVAGFQAFVRNLSLFRVEWASRMLFDIEWADAILRNGTLWVAFLGASLATYHGRHIGIDVIMRIVPLRAKYAMRGLSNLAASIIAVGLVFCFSSASYLNLTERPMELEVLAEDGAIHICDATDQAAKEVDMEKPAIFCTFRSGLALIGIPAETARAAFQLIVPIMFFVVAFRLFGRSISAWIVLFSGEQAIAAAEAQESLAEAKQLKAIEDSIASLPPAKNESDSA
ncbi:MAG: TRAP transporter small permease subunit [Deltaproteobacteria bacterium]|nr:TRAP transporter small permease subunit [Deltaproteobacteria bacterium]